MKSLIRKLLFVMLVLLQTFGVAAERSGSGDATKKALAVAEAKAVQIFAVSSGDKTPEHPFYKRGSQMGFAVDDSFGKELVLTRGKTYIFDVDTSIQHDFYFTTVARGKGAGTVSDGVIGQFTYNTKVAFTPTNATPDRLFYACRNHEYMGGLIYVVDEGKSVVREILPALVKPPPAPKPMEVLASEVSQKIAFAKMLLASQPAKQTEAEGSVEERALLLKAATAVSDAEREMASGDNAAALALIEQALDNAKGAVGQLAEETVEIDPQVRYAELLADFRGYKETYRERYQQSQQRNDGLFDDKPTPEMLQQMDNGAVELAKNGSYNDANEILLKARLIVTSALVSAFEGEEVIYSKEFTTPLEEYQYELARYESFVKLIPLALEQKRPGIESTTLVNRFVERGTKIRREAGELASDGDYATAVLGLQEATRQLQQALQVTGVR